MEESHPFSEEQLDYLAEMLNVAASHAATALSQLLRCKVGLSQPIVHVLPAARVPSILGGPDAPVACVRMKLLGDVSGYAFFLAPRDEMDNLIALAENSFPPRSAEDVANRTATLGEVGNIATGAYLAAIQQFCKLSIFHTVPVVAVDVLQSLLDESLATLNLDSKTIVIQTILVGLNEFTVGDHRLHAHLVIVPTADSQQKLLDSMKEAMKAYGLPTN